MSYLEAAVLVLQIVTLLTIGWLLKNYFPSYFAEKGKNLATKEDAGRITTEVERVRVVYAKDLENTKNDLQARLEMIKHNWCLPPKHRNNIRALRTRATLTLSKPSLE
jgi:hypothetical protein